ncbi:MAG: T9SS type A sorting domain-containing protein [Bacteroidota bacterium]
MKKITLLLIIVLISSLSYAQKCEYKNQGSNKTTLSTAPDFTITTTDGVVRNLFTTLNSGKTVFVDLFFVDCGYCQTYAPIIDQSYVAHGSGSGNIVYWGISDRDADAAVNTYKTTYGVSNPCAGSAGGGAAAHAAFIAGQNFTGWPTYSVVCPSKNLYFDVNYPPSATGFDTYYSGCGATDVAELSSKNAMIDGIFPMPATTELNLLLHISQNSQNYVTLSDMLGRQIKKISLEQYEIGNHTATLALDGLESGSYVLALYCNGAKTQSFPVVISK